MIEHEVDDDAAHGNVKPKRQRPASDVSMFLDPLGPAVIDREQRERNDHHCQRDVRHKHGEVHAADPSLMPEGNGADLSVMKQGSSPDLCVKAEEAPRLRLGCLGDLLFLEE